MGYIWGMFFCKRCGYMDRSLHSEMPSDCPCCHYNHIIVVPNEEYHTVFEKFREKFNNELPDEMYLCVEEFFREKYIYHDNPEFKKDEYDKMLAYREKKEEEELEYFSDIILLNRRDALNDD